jgi:hypothetical protein
MIANTARRATYGTAVPGRRSFTLGSPPEEGQMTRTTSSISSLVILLFIALAVPSAVAIDGPLANATVSLGEWQTDPPLDRFPICHRDYVTITN